MKIDKFNSWSPTQKKPLIIAGPCSAESEEQVLSLAKLFKESGKVHIFRAGIWKPRTRPNSFEGIGPEGLPWLERIQNEIGLPVTTEVANTAHVELALKYNVKILWIGARTTVSPFAVQEIAEALRGTKVTVMIKNPVNVDLSLWVGALERLYQVGISQLVAIHRGFSTAEKGKYRNKPMWEIPIELKRLYPELPFICDPSHIAGDRKLVEEVAQKALEFNMDGLMIETHADPDHALSDANQQIDPQKLQAIISNLHVKSDVIQDKNASELIARLRLDIDNLDKELIYLLHSRLKIVEKIGAIKKDHEITPLQINRLNEMLRNRKDLARKLNLDEQFINDLFHLVHLESLKRQ